MTHRSDAHLIFRSGRAARRADFAVRPRLRREPSDGVVAIGARCAKNVVVAFGKEMAALILHNVRVAALHRGQRCLHVRRQSIPHVPEIKIVRRANPNDRHLSSRILRPINIRRQPNAVPHRHHHLPFDDGHRFELLLCLQALLSLFRRKRRPLLRPHRANRDRTGNTTCQNHPANRFLHKSDYSSPKLRRDYASCH